LDTEGFGTPDLQLIFFPALAASHHADRAWHFTFELETDSTSSEFLWPRRQNSGSPLVDNRKHDAGLQIRFLHVLSSLNGFLLFFN
jgi:hypothetical protein